MIHINTYTYINIYLQYVYTHIHTTFDIMEEKPTYSQNWPAYNHAKTHEKLLFFKMLRELIDDVVKPEQSFRAGRPNLPFGDLLFSACLREYSSYSSRKTIAELQIAHKMGFISHVPHFNSITNFLRSDAIYEQLQKLIIISALPLKKVESAIAVDSTGFSVSPFESWNNNKWGKPGSKRGWIKAHVATGTKTQIICSAEITDRKSHDSTMFSPLVLTCSNYFSVKEVSADKAYSSKNNISLVRGLDAYPYIMFKKNVNAYTAEFSSFDWLDAWNFFSENEEEFMKHYHKRSNVECAFSMIKRKYGFKLKGKHFTSQRNELLCKFLVHNISVLIQEMFELGLEVKFMQVEQVAAQK
ncbi:transposase [Candidatus Micrarchaeota archaeon CG10_big_fil_rev_8_21_14_0_10_45_29]|nr:MAG: transposase [Candidatus Micrarchaeota archaeon CG10_big_fil_rev_8_21_14_0_10_45_29]QBM01536.1 hypothetical protein [uncultured archaeon]